MEEVKKAKKQKKENKKSLITVFNDFKGEFKKIIWPGRVELAKKTVTVLVACAIVGAIIMVFDFGLAAAFEQFTKFFG